VRFGELSAKYTVSSNIESGGSFSEKNRPAAGSFFAGSRSKARKIKWFCPLNRIQGRYCGRLTGAEF
jgi:hypothetical protein